MGCRALKICKVVALQKVPHAFLSGKLANMLNIYENISISTVWWLTYPSEKYESQLG
jgi:hypothetical protein